MTIGELVTMVNIALGDLLISSCDAGDVNRNGSIDIGDLITAVNAALGTIRTPTTETPSVPEPTATSTNTPIPTPIVIFNGSCEHPGLQGLQPCDPDTAITASLCLDRKRCLDDSSARTFLASAAVQSGGAFSIAVGQPEGADLETVIFEADISGAQVAAYRAVTVIGFSTVGTGGVGAALARGIAAAAQTTPAINVVLDPSAEGTVRAVDIAGLENVQQTDIDRVTARVRTDARAMFGGQTDSGAADLAAAIAFDVFFSNLEATAVSPDGRFAYAVSRDDNSVSTFSREATTGALALIQVLRDGVGGVSGMVSPVDIVVSPDSAGSRVYVGALGVHGDAMVAVFSRDMTTGVLTFTEAQSNPGPLANGTRSVAVSGDGENVYVASDAAVAVFQKNAQSGGLTYLELQRQQPFSATAAQDAPAGSTTVVLQSVPPDFLTSGRLFSYGVPNCEVQSVDIGYTLSGNTLHLSEPLPPPIPAECGLLAGATVSAANFVMQGVRSIAVSPDQAFVYAAAYLSREVVVFKRNASSDGRLTFLAEDPHPIADDETLQGFLSVAISPDGANLYVSASAFGGTRRGAVIVFTRVDDGTLTFKDAYRQGVNGVTGLGGGYSAITVSNDKANVYVASGSTVTTFQRDPTSGALNSPDTTPLDPGGAFDARSVKMSPDGANLYVGGLGGIRERDQGVVIFQRNAATQGDLRLLGVGRSFVSRLALNGANGVAVSPDGMSVYATGEQDDALTVFSRNSQTGALTYVETHYSGELGADLARPSGLALDPVQGSNVYVSAGGAVNAYRRGMTGRLTVIQSLAQGAGTSSVAVSPDAANVYASLQSPGSGAIATFGRDSAGMLSFGTAEPDGLEQQPGRSDGLKSLVLSPDGLDLYGAGSDEHSDSTFSPAIPILSRSETGSLSSPHVERHNVDGVSIPFLANLAPSPDGSYVYSVGLSAGSFPPTSSSDVPPGVVFSRDAQSGQLVVRQILTDFFNGVAVTVSPDPKGANVYIGAQDQSGNSLVIVYARDADTGLLTVVDQQIDGVGGVNGIASPTSLAVSPDGKNVYVTGSIENALVVFRRDPANGKLSFVESQR